MICGKLKKLYPAANIVLCSTTGEIYDDAVFDKSVSSVAIEFEKAQIKTLQINSREYADSFAVGNFLFSNLPQQELEYVLIISDGGLVNASELVRGIESIKLSQNFFTV